MVKAKKLEIIPPISISKKLSIKQYKIISNFIPEWMPHSLVERCGGSINAIISFSDAERAVLRKLKFEKVSDWTERNRWVRTSSIPGWWQHIFTPYLPTLMDSLRTSGVEMGIICKAPQTAITEAAINILGHSVEHFPGPAMIVYPDKDTAKDIMRDRIIPMFEDSKRLRRHLTGEVGDESTIRINLRHMPIFLAWAGSVSRLGTRSIRLMILDEIDKYPGFKKEASAEALAEKRTITWRDRSLMIKLSTPTTQIGSIWLAFTEEAHARFDWHVKCPYCGKQQIMIFDNIRWPENIKEPEIVLRDRLAVYECSQCTKTWDDNDRDLAVRAGVWIERTSGLEIFAHIKTYSPKKLGFHVPSWISYFISLSIVAHSFLKWEKSGRINDLKDFMNQHKAEPWVAQYEEREENTILALCDDRPMGIVPGPINTTPRVAALVAGIDTQSNYFCYVIRAFGYGENEESWLIKSGTVPTFDALDEVIWRTTYYDGSGGEYRVKVAVIDAMGAPGRTKEVYSWCAKRKRAMAYQGKQSQSNPVSYSSIEYFPSSTGAKIKIKGGLLLRRVDTTFFKSDLAAKLSITPGDPGTFWIHSNSHKNKSGHVRDGVLKKYASEMCAEVFNLETLIWENPKNRDNHFWDCEVMCLVAAWELGLRHQRPIDINKKNKKQPIQPQRSIGSSVGDKLAMLSRRK